MSNLKLLAVSSAVATGLLFAQGERATISGTVTDTSQAVVPGVAITVRNVDTNVASHTESNSAGIYVIPALPPGIT